MDGLHFFLPAPVPQAKLPTAKAKAKALCAELTHYSLLSLLITEHAPDMPVVFFWGFKRASELIKKLTKKSNVLPKFAFCFEGFVSYANG